MYAIAELHFQLESQKVYVKLLRLSLNCSQVSIFAYIHLWSSDIYFCFGEIEEELFNSIEIARQMHPRTKLARITPLDVLKPESHLACLQGYLQPHSATTMPSYLYLYVTTPCSSMYNIEIGLSFVGTQHDQEARRGCTVCSSVWMMACFVGVKWSPSGK